MLYALVATKDAALLYVASQALQRLNFEVTVVHDAEDLLKNTRGTNPDLLILDFDLSHVGAWKLCRKLRRIPATAQTPLIAITPLGDNRAEIQMLEAGADACIIKPLDADLLCAHVRALARRTLHEAAGQQLRAGSIIMDLARWTVSVENASVHLTKTEFKLLRILIEARGRTLTREYLLTKVWSHSNVRSLQTKTVDVHIGRLRHKLGAPGRHIITVRDVGFRFNIMPEWIVGPGSRLHA
jgi:two-component system phosphate regulon response regulator PhoB